MDDAFDQIVRAMRQFLDQTLSPQQFVEHYFDLWRTIRDQQHTALDNQTAVREKLQALRKAVLNEEITYDEYEREIGPLYEAMADLPVRPGSSTDKILSHVFVETDAYEEDPELREPYQIDEDTLREVVREALEDLAATGVE